MERIAKKRHLPFLTSKAKAKQRYALDMKTDEFIEMAYDVWRSIGNIATTVTRYFTKVPDDMIVEIPQNAEFIQSVTSVDQQAVVTTFDSGGEKERHVPAVSVRSNTPERNQSLTTSPGESINYTVLDENTIQITSPNMINNDIMIVYNAINVDDDGLPLLNDKEVEAIAAEVARRWYVRKSFQDVGPAANNRFVSMLQLITAEATRLMAAAKIDEKITDDAIDKMLDIKTSWDRKVYGRRFDLLK
jgi:hypothetical protein